MQVESAVAVTSDREIVTTRVFDAPRALVFEAWTRPEHLARWWGPSGFTITTHEHDFRPGGSFRLTMHGPDGTDYANHHTYEEIVEDERIVTSHRGGRDGEGDDVDARHVVTFADEGEGKTRVTLRLVFRTRAERDAVVEKYNAVEGGKQTLARLAAHVAAMADAPPPFVVTRTFDAPRRLVFEAWTKAEHVARWFTPRPLTTSQCEVDFRPGGVFRVVMRMPGGLEHPFEGRFGEIVAPERLRFSGKIHGEIDVDTAVTFADLGEQTTITVRQTYSRASDATRGAPDGWRASLDQLGEVVAELRAR
jgi:uncharacterized protein YndB with AHSA1/START domain